MTLGVRALTAGIILTLVAGLLIRWDHQQQIEHSIAVASADAVLAAQPQQSDAVIDKLLRVRTATQESLDAIAATEHKTVSLIEAFRKRRARLLAAKQRAARREAAQQRQIVAEKQARASGGLLIGDSVSLGAESCLAPLNYRLDSEVGRQFAVGLARLRVQAAQGLPANVIIHLGTNGPFSQEGFQQVMDLIGSQRRAVWVTISLPGRSQYSFVDSLNEMIRTMSAEYPNARVADFATAAAQHPEWMYEDGIHINSAGCAGYASVVDEAVRSD